MKDHIAITDGGFSIPEAVRKMVVLVWIAAAVVAAGHRFETVRSWHVTIQQAFNPVHQTVTVMRLAWNHVFRGEEFLPAGSEIATTREWLAAIKVRAEQLEDENRELRTLLGLATSGGFDGVVAEIVRVGDMGTPEKLTLNRGARNGVKKGAIVLGYWGDTVAVLGRVQSVGITNSQIETVWSRTLRVAARQNGSPAFVYEGNGRGGNLRYVPIQETITKGAQIITAEEGVIFPAGLLLGEVVDVAAGEMFQTVQVRPYCEPRKLYYALVVLS